MDTLCGRWCSECMNHSCPVGKTKNKMVEISWLVWGSGNDVVTGQHQLRRHEKTRAQRECLELLCSALLRGGHRTVTYNRTDSVPQVVSNFKEFAALSAYLALRYVHRHFRPHP